MSKLFQRRGVTALANDTVVDVGLTMLAMALTLGYMYALYLLVWLLIALAVVMRFGGIVLIFLLFAGVFGYLACGLVIATTLEVVRSGFKTVFVCFVQVTCCLQCFAEEGGGVLCLSWPMFCFCFSWF